MDATTRIEELRRALARTDPGAFLAEARVIRRVIRELHGYARLTATIPHTDSQLVAADDIRSLTHPDELGLTSFDSLPDFCLLICQPEEEELQHWPLQELMQLTWRRLFHGTIDRELQRASRTSLTRAVVQSRIAAIGQVEFDEAHFVLHAEQRLVSADSRVEGYCEFAATFLEMQRFAPDLLPVWFPSLSGRLHVEQTIRRDVDPDAVYHTTRLYGAPLPDLTPRVARDEARLTHTRRDWLSGSGATPSDRAYLRQLRRREYANERGNTVAAAIYAMRAAERATTEDKRRSAAEKARADIRQLVERLRQALDFPQDDSDDWQSSLWELATNAIHGFWNADKRLLYDLQKVCLDHERVTYKVDLVKWIVSRGRRPLRRPLNSVREVMMAKHLASSASRLVSVRLSGMERERLDGLLHSAAHLAEHQMRKRTRQALRKTLLDVGLVPESLPEHVAFDKLIEEALDCIAARGYLTMGYLRDAISRNDLKLPDLKHPRELILGDHLLRADDRLDLAMDGVYRRGEFYLRWLQIISSAFFGTPAGRFATQFLIIPFGGAKVIVVGATHLIHVVTGHKTHAPAYTPPSADAAADAETAVPAAETVATAALAPQDSANRESATMPALEMRPAVVAVPATGQPGSSQSVDSHVAETLQPGSSDPWEGFVSREVSSLSLVLAIGFVLMGLIHIGSFRQWALNATIQTWKLLKKGLVDLPLTIIRLPAIQRLWRSRPFVRARRWVINPALFAWLVVRLLPGLLLQTTLSWWWTATLAVLLSLGLNSRLGRDAEELTAEWLTSFWHHFRARVIMAVIDWIIDIFKTILGVVERFLYAVDEWLRFHSGESWLTVVAKAVLGVIWSFVSFVIRIYVNLLIEPTFHPVKHFPVVTVAHKMFFPFLVVLEYTMRTALSPYLGMPLAVSVTWFNIFFLPGFFGFAVWELKENWRLYAANRRSSLAANIVGSHGETVPRLLRPGFHSGTLPKLYRRMRHLEQQPASFRRFSLRRAARENLEHVERDVRHFVDRELIHLLELCPVWQGFGLRCGRVRAASNSLLIPLECDRLSDRHLRLVFQEQSGWVVASTIDSGWLPFASGQQIRSLENALEGFYRRSGIELVREQMEQNLIRKFAYDISATGLTIWPDREFHREVTVDLSRPHILRPLPASDVVASGLPTVVDRIKVVFSDSETDWSLWLQLWQPSDAAAGPGGPPVACSRPPQRTLIRVPQ